MKKRLKILWENIDLILGITLAVIAVVSSLRGDRIGFFGNMTLAYIILFSISIKQSIERLKLDVLLSLLQMLESALKSDKNEEKS